MSQPPERASTSDHETYEALADLTDNPLPAAREQAKNWLGLCTVVSGLVAVVTVLGGPQAGTLNTVTRGVVVALIGIAFVMLAAGVVTMYRAAFGDPTALRAVRSTPIAGLHARVLNAQAAAAREVRAKLSVGSALVLAGTGLVVLTRLVSWLV